MSEAEGLELFDGGDACKVGDFDHLVCEVIATAFSEFFFEVGHGVEI